MAFRSLRGFGPVFLSFGCLVLACGESASDGAGGSAGRPDSGSSGSGGSADSAPADAGEKAAPECVRTCSVATDCAKAGANPPFDGNNWDCVSGRCRWLGCLNDGECAFFGGVCRLKFLSNADVMTCTEACTDTSVCVETLESVNLDKWSCVDGGCKYAGCLSDNECATDFGPGAKCDRSTEPYPSCVRPCAAPADCVAQGASTAQDADNWACREGLCVYTGCNSDAECTGALGGAAACDRR